MDWLRISFIYKDIEVFTKIKSLLPEEYKDLLYKLNEIDGAMAAISDKMIYEKGLQDGIKLNCILRIS